MFESARLKLTLWYLLIIMLISLCFSMVIYGLLSREVERFASLQRVRLEKRFQDVYVFQPGAQQPNPVLVTISEEDLVQDLKQRLINILIVVNSTIFIVSGGISYLFAGKTLRPIKDMVNEQHRFISDASHEFRTPLTSLRSAFEVYLRGKQSLIEAKVVITESLDEVKKLQQLSDSLLQLAQYHKPNGHTLFEKISLDSTISTALRRMKPIAVQKDIQLQYEKQEFSVIGDKDSLTNLWVILIDNAIKYSPEKSIIKFSTVKKDGYVLTTIQDQGIGIDEKALPHIFDRFYRANLARSRNGAGGYGLGLSIAKKIVDQHKGSIIAKSKPNEGTTFTIKLPVK